MYIIKHKTEEVYLRKLLKGAWYSLVTNIDKARVWNNKPDSILKKVASKYDKSSPSRTLSIGWGQSYKDYNTHDFEVRQVKLILV